jgi:voltage-gated potassium channel
MITLSSVGYGGILPLNPYVRLIAALESLIGIFYIAVVVARLVSSYRPDDHGSPRSS